MKCEANGCKAELPAKDLMDGKGEPTGWRVTSFPPGWAIAFVENTDKKTQRTVFLCPVHGSGIERSTIH